MKLLKKKNMYGVMKRYFEDVETLKKDEALIEVLGNIDAIDLDLMKNAKYIAGDYEYEHKPRGMFETIYVEDLNEDRVFQVCRLEEYENVVLLVKREKRKQGFSRTLGAAFDLEWISLDNRAITRNIQTQIILRFLELVFQIEY